jgi:hypothetical protein
MAGGTEMAPFAGEGQKILMAAIFAFHAGKAVVQVATIEIAINHLLDIRPPGCRTIALFIKKKI